MRLILTCLQHKVRNTNLPLSLSLSQSLSLSLTFLSLSLVIPQFGVLSHVSSLRLPSGHSGPALTLSNAAQASLSSPRLLVVGAGICAASPLGELLLGM